MICSKELPRWEFFAGTASGREESLLRPSALGRALGKAVTVPILTIPRKNPDKIRIFSSAPRVGFEPTTISLHMVHNFRNGVDYIISPKGSGYIVSTHLSFDKLRTSH